MAPHSVGRARKACPTVLWIDPILSWWRSSLAPFTLFTLPSTGQHGGVETSLGLHTSFRTKGNLPHNDTLLFLQT
ncbi:hypothetical protein BJX66DRAFT_297692 [Aspergillus keveii]|uniref:Uncharacterized protein n=1 Tax=Aspergillus keveii TaxID=714993 RepID=A0ABR4GE98_9EURO